MNWRTRPVLTGGGTVEGEGLGGTVGFDLACVVVGEVIFGVGDGEGDGVGGLVAEIKSFNEKINTSSSLQAQAISYP